MAKKKTNISRIILRVLGIILLIVGVALIFNKQISNQMIRHNQQSTLNGLNKSKVTENLRKKKGCMILVK